MITYDFKTTKVIVHASQYDPDVPHSIEKKVLNIFKEIHLMPDTHVGMSVPIGFVAKYDGKIIPSIVGVDIGCGMLAYDIPKNNIDFRKLEDFINTYIPSGARVHTKEQPGLNYLNGLTFNTDELGRIKQSLGTLGGGNHFIEIVNRKNSYTIVIHTGSRSLGSLVCNHHESLIDEEKGYLEGQLLRNYIQDMKIAQKFANHNRITILMNLLKFFKVPFIESNAYDTPHNYVDFENEVIHKGSISAAKDKPVIIPLNMRDGVVFAKGLGNKDWMNSAPHGAGRALSRKEAKAAVSLDEFKESMKHVNTFSVKKSTIDESPFAYKNSDLVINDSLETITDIEVALPVYNFKSK